MTKLYIRFHDLLHDRMLDKTSVKKDETTVDWNKFKEQSKSLAIRNGNIYQINTLNSAKIPKDLLKMIDTAQHKKFEEYPFLKGTVNQIIFDENEIASAVINSKLQTSLKLTQIFSVQKRHSITY